MSERPLLLDTHVWLWLTLGIERIQGTQAFAAIEKARDSGGILISIISVWEVGMLASKGRVRLRQDYRQWIKHAFEERDFRLQPMTLGIAMETSSLPGEFHADPADRILVATARELNVPLVTADARILAYANSGHVHAIEV